MSLTGDAYASNAKNINDLAGPFANDSVGAGEGIDFAAGTFYGPSPDGSVIGIGGSAGAGLGVSGSVTVTKTTVIPLTLSEIIEFIYGHPPKDDCQCRMKKNHHMSPLGAPIS